MPTWSPLVARTTCWRCWFSNAIGSRSSTFHDSPAYASSPFHIPCPHSGCM